MTSRFRSCCDSVASQPSHLPDCPADPFAMTHAQASTLLATLLAEGRIANADARDAKAMLDRAAEDEGDTFDTFLDAAAAILVMYTDAKTDLRPFRRYEIAWSFGGYTQVDARDEIEARDAFRKLDHKDVLGTAARDLDDTLDIADVNEVRA